MSEPFEDLLKDSSESFEDGNYFLVTIVELELEQEYPVQFRWKYKDGVTEDWSAVKTLNSQTKTTPVAPNLDSADVEGGAGFIKVSWGGFAGGVPATDFDRVNIYISGGSFGDGSKPAGFFKKAETRTFIADPGIYVIVLKIQTVNGAESSASISRSVTVKPIEEQVEAPIAPTGFTAEPKLGGLEITWSGGYAGGASWFGFQGINIYAGTSASLTPGTYIKVGQLTANKVENKTFLPVDGTYVRYDNIAYIHASSVNRATPPVESSISANVANATPRRVVNTDIIDAAITEAKIALNAVTEVKINNAAITEAKIATSAITETKIASDAITTPKIAAGAIVAGKIAAGAVTTEKLEALAITADKIAANAITAVKIAAGEITASKIAALTITGDKIAANTINVGKLEANTISVGNLEAGDIKASSFIRAGAAGNSRVELAGSATSGVPAGLHIYNGTNPTAVLAAPLGGGLTIRGALVASEISTSSTRFTVDTGGFLTATSANITGAIKATSGYIGSTDGLSGWTINVSGLQSTSGSVVLNGTTGEISGATITGGVLRTTNQRIRINDTADQITFHPVSASNIGRLYMSSTSTVGQLLLEAPYNSTRAFLQMDTFADTPSVELSASTGTVQLTGNNVRLNSTGNFFTGNLTSSESSTSTGTHLGYDGVIQARRSAATPLFSHRTDGNGRVITFFLGGSSGGGINATAGGTPTFASASDYRLKENIVDYINATDRIKAARLRKFNLKSIPEKEFIGFIAHEFADVDPEFVIGEKDAVDEDGNPIYQEIGTTNLVYYLTGALKESIIKIEELEQRLDALEG